MTNAFTLAKSNITVIETAEHYGLHPNRAGMICCLFHPDKNPSMKLDRRYYCFGCQATGDVIDFTAKLFGISPKEAADKLVLDFSLDGECKRADVNEPKKTFEINRRPEMGRHIHDAADVLLEYARLLRAWQKDHAPKITDNEWHPLFVEALNQKDYIDYLLDILLSGNDDERQQFYRERQKEVESIAGRIHEYNRSKKTAGIDR